MAGAVLVLLAVGVSSITIAHAQNATSGTSGGDKIKSALSAGQGIASAVQPGSRILVAICPPTATDVSGCDVFVGQPARPTG
jgi:hypothetical protein